MLRTPEHGGVSGVWVCLESCGDLTPNTECVVSPARARFVYPGQSQAAMGELEEQAASDKPFLFRALLS